MTELTARDAGNMHCTKGEKIRPEQTDISHNFLFIVIQNKHSAVRGRRMSPKRINATVTTGFMLAVLTSLRTAQSAETTEETGSTPGSVFTSGEIEVRKNFHQGNARF